MKVGTIIKTNQKGQIVIPQAIRKAIGITPNTPLNVFVRGGGVYLYPVKGVIRDLPTENSFIETLRRTQGAWGPETAGERKLSEARRKKDLKTVKRLQNAW